MKLCLLQMSTHMHFFSISVSFDLAIFWPTIEIDIFEPGCEKYEKITTFSNSYLSEIQIASSLIVGNSWNYSMEKSRRYSFSFRLPIQKRVPYQSKWKKTHLEIEFTLKF